MNDKIYIKNMTDGGVIINLPDIGFRRELPTFGTRIAMDKNVFDEAMYHPGFSYMVEHGMIFVEDMEAKKQFGIEPEDATEPVNIIEIDDKFLKRCIGVMPHQELKSVLEKLTREQKKTLVDYTIKNYTSLKLDKANLIDEYCGSDLLKAIQRMKEAEQE